MQFHLFVNNFHSNIWYRKSSGVQGSDNTNRINLFIQSLSFRLLLCVWNSSWCRCILWLPRDHCGTGHLNLRNPGRTSSTLWATVNKSTSSFISWPADTFDNACVQPSHDLQTLLTICPSISWPADTFDKCVHPSHDLQTLLTMFVFISWPADTFDSVCVHPSHDLQMLLTVFVFISWPADTFDSVCVNPSHDLQTLLTMFVFLHLMTCRHFWQCLCQSISWPADTFEFFCVHPSYDLQTLLTVFGSIHLMTCRHFWIFLCPSILWPADIFDSVFTSIHIMTFRHFLMWALLSLDNTTFSFSTNCFQGTIWYWCHYFVYQAPWQRHTLHVWYLNLTMQERAAEHSWTTKSPRQLQTNEQEINRLPKVTLCGWQDTKIQLLTKCHNFVLAQFKMEKAYIYCNIKWLYM